MTMTMPDPSAGQLPTPRPVTGDVGYQANFGGAEQLAHATIGAGDEIAAQAHQMMAEQDKIDTLRAEDAYTQLRNKQLDMTSGPQGFLNLKGAAAVTGPQLPQVAGQFDAAATQIGASLGNDNQRMKYNARAAMAGIQLKENFLRHQVTQSVAYQKDVTDNGVAGEMRQIAANPTSSPADENAISSSIVRINALVDNYANDPQVGMSGSAIDTMKHALAQQAGTTRLMSWASTDPVSAYKFFKATQTEYDPAHRMQLDSSLKHLADPIEANTMADNAVKSVMVNTTLTGQGATPADWKGEPMKGFVGDPQVISDQIKQALNLSDEDRTAMLAQVAQQQQAKGGTAVQANNKQDILGRIGDMFAKVQSDAEQAHPGDAFFAEMARTQLRAKLHDVVQAQDGISRQAHGNLMAKIMGMGQDGSQASAPITDPNALFADPNAMKDLAVITPEAYRGVMGAVDTNARRARGEFKASDPAVVADVYRRMALPQGDPDKITSSLQITPLYAKGLDPRDGDRIIHEIGSFNSPEGNPFIKSKLQAFQVGKDVFTRSMVGQIQPDVASEAWLGWTQAVNTKIDAYNKAHPEMNGDASDLWRRPTQGHPNPDYVLDPGYTSSFMPNARAAVAGAAQGAAPAASSADAKYSVGQTYAFKQGNLQYMGGPASVASSWKAVQIPKAGQ